MPDETWGVDDRRIPKGVYTSPTARSSFRRPDSVRRMQLTSPTPVISRSPRQSTLSARRPGSRGGEVPSQRSMMARGSPRPRKRTGDVPKRSDDTKQLPLVLLHVTLLPVSLPWEREIVQELLPQSTLDQLQLLRSKMTDLVMHRGILLPHPRDEYDVLEERLLESLELREERITKDGHFHRPRDSTSSVESAEGSDSALGSSVEGLTPDEGGCCTVCHHSHSTSSKGTGRWTIRVYAANGLMRAAAWSAAWSEMESVDVEILPWISEELKFKLDARRDEATHVERLRANENEERLRAAVDEQMRLDRFENPRFEEAEFLQHASESPPQQYPQAAEPVPATNLPATEKAPMSNDGLPQIYRPSQVPLSVLMKNYVLLLAQDGKNVAVFTFAALLVLLGIRNLASATPPNLAPAATSASIPSSELSSGAENPGASTTLELTTIPTADHVQTINTDFEAHETNDLSHNVFHTVQFPIEAVASSNTAVDEERTSVGDEAIFADHPEQDESSIVEIPEISESRAAKEDMDPLSEAPVKGSDDLTSPTESIASFPAVDHDRRNELAPPTVEPTCSLKKPERPPSPEISLSRTHVNEMCPVHGLEDPPDATAVQHDQYALKTSPRASSLSATIGATSHDVGEATEITRTVDKELVATPEEPAGHLEASVSTSEVLPPLGTSKAAGDTMKDVLSGPSLPPATCAIEDDSGNA